MNIIYFILAITLDNPHLVYIIRATDKPLEFCNKEYFSKTDRMSPIRSGPGVVLENGVIIIPFVQGVFTRELWIVPQEEMQFFRVDLKESMSSMDSKWIPDMTLKERVDSFFETKVAGAEHQDEFGI